MAKRNILIFGASQGLGKFYFQQLEASLAFHPIGISRKKPSWLKPNSKWIIADLSKPLEAIEEVFSQLPDIQIDTLVYNVGIWESKGFEPDYDFLKDEPAYLQTMVNTNITSCILQIQRLLPNLLQSKRPQIIFTGSTSGLDNVGRPEVTFNASKFALRGIAQSLRATYKKKGLQVTIINPGYINTDAENNSLDSSDDKQVSMKDLWAFLDLLLNLNPGTAVTEINAPSMDEEEC